MTWPSRKLYRLHVNANIMYVHCFILTMHEIMIMLKSVLLFFFLFLSFSRLNCRSRHFYYLYLLFIRLQGKLLQVIDGFRSSLSSGISPHVTEVSFFANSVSKLRDRCLIAHFRVLTEMSCI